MKSMRINHNISALNAWRALGQTDNAMTKSLEKLSSGMRINRAADDAAGLAISEKMRGQIRGLNQAIRNAQDAISLIQTAEGALNETHAILQRMRELAVQAASDTNTDEDRQAIQEEIDQLMEELTRIGNTTEFNTKTLLDGTFVGTFHIGANENQNISLTIAKMDADELLGAGPTPATGELAGVTFTAKKEGEAGNGIQIVFKAPETTGKADLSISVSDNIITVSLATDEEGNITSTVDDIVAAINNDDAAKNLVTASGSGTSTVSTGSVELSGGNDGASATPATGELAGVTFTAVDPGKEGNDIEIEFVDPGKGNEDLSISVSGNKITVTLATDENGNITSTAAEIAEAIKNNTEASALVTASVGTGAVQAGTATLSGGNDGASATSSVDVTTQTGANKAIQTIQDALDKVSGERSKLGALQNRLEHTINNLSVAAENLTAAESRIRDVDMAKEMMEFTKNQILIQAGTAMLANANVRPQSVLQLLG
jgi:flagellin